MSLIIILNWSYSECPGNRGNPNISSNRMHPRDHMSMDPVYLFKYLIHTLTSSPREFLVLYKILIEYMYKLYAPQNMLIHSQSPLFLYLTLYNIYIYIYITLRRVYFQVSCHNV